jgi:hypothetical protein
MPRSAATIRVVENEPSLHLKAAYEGDGESNRKKFDIIVSNSSQKQRLLSSFRIRWIYVKGPFASVESGIALKPIEKYALALHIDPDKGNRVLEKNIDMYPPILLPPKNESGPSVVSFRLEVFYDFAGSRLNYHPNSPWDIKYDISIQDDSGEELRILRRSWKHGAATEF